MSINEIKKISDGTDEIETPFEGDFLGRKALADSLEGYVSRLQVGATIAIDAEWGAGKSWFVNHWKKQLENNDYEVIYLNAFSQDYIDDPFLTISMEIANHLDANEEKIEKLKKGIGNVWRSFLPHAPMLIFSAITTLAGGGFFAQRVNEAINEIKNSGDFSEKFGEIINEQLEEHLTEQVESYQKEKQSLEYFKTCLKDITQNQGKPIIFIVDELDRCKPEFSIRLIERIKHFFDVPKVVFVLSMNKSQLEESINSYYGFKNDNNYLDKFIDTTIRLKKVSDISLSYEKCISSMSENLGVHFGNIINTNAVVSLCYLFNPNPRQLIRVMNKFSLFYREDFAIQQKIFLFLILIVFELHEITTPTYKDFKDIIIKSASVKYDAKIDEINLSNSNTAIEYFGYMRRYPFANSALDSFLRRCELEANNRSDSINQREINLYFPDSNIDNSGKDLIESWYNYIYMIDVLIEED